MNEWGVPDWLNEAAYGDTTSWSLNRWRWEFLRRRSDLREEFDLKKCESYEHKLRFCQVTGRNPESVSKPEEPGFQVFSSILDWELPNPRIGDQPEIAISWRWPERSIREFTSETAPKGFQRVDFDLNQPIEPQLKAVKKLLSDMQEHEVGRKVQTRRHPEKWPTYLRVLDGRAAGASWAKISGILTHSAATEQTARDIHRQALALCFKF